VKVRIDRPDERSAQLIFAKYLTTDLPVHAEELKQHGGDAGAVIHRFIDMVTGEMYSQKEENQFLEVTYASGERELLYFRDFASGALIDGIVARAKKYAIKRLIATGERGVKSEDLVHAVRDEFHEHEDLPNTTNPDDWAKIAGRKSEKIIHVRTMSGRAATESRKIETIAPGHYL